MTQTHAAEVQQLARGGQRHLHRLLRSSITALITTLLTMAPATGGSAAGSAVLTLGGAGGGTVQVGDALDGSGMMRTADIMCNVANLDAAVDTNPVAPGTATASVTSMPSSCTGANVTFGNRPYVLSIDDTDNLNVTLSAGGGGGIQVTVVMSTFFGNVTCTYRPHDGSLMGSVPLGSSGPVTFTSQQLDKTSGPGTCRNPQSFSASYNVVDTTQGSQRVVVN